MESRYRKSFKEILDSVKGNSNIQALVHSSEEKLVAYKILKNFAKFSPATRQALTPAFESVASNFARHRRTSEHTVNSYQPFGNLSRPRAQRA